jgi:hypothetical protein
MTSWMEWVCLGDNPVFYMMFGNIFWIVGKSTSVPITQNVSIHCHWFSTEQNRTQVRTLAKRTYICSIASPSWGINALQTGWKHIWTLYQTWPCNLVFLLQFFQPYTWYVSTWHCLLLLFHWMLNLVVVHQYLCIRLYQQAKRSLWSTDFTSIICHSICSCSVHGIKEERKFHVGHYSFEKDDFYSNCVEEVWLTVSLKG